MFNFLNFLVESSEKNSIGVAAELLTQKHLNNGKMPSRYNDEAGRGPSEALAHHTSIISPETATTIHDHAKKIADAVRDHFPHHEVIGTTWSSSKGDLQRHHDTHKTGGKQTEYDNADFIVHLRHKKTGEVSHHGVSLKYGKDPTDLNPGIPSISKLTNSSEEGANKIINNHNKKIDDAFESVHKGFSKLSKEAKADVIRQAKTTHPEVHKLGNEIARQRSTELANHFHSGFKDMPIEGKRAAVSAISGSGQKSIPTSKVVMNPNTSKVKVSDEDTVRNQKLSRYSDIHSEVVGGKIHFHGVLPDGTVHKRIASLEIRSKSTNSSPHVIKTTGKGRFKE